MKADTKSFSLLASSTCLFGGSFDPVHEGHRWIAAQAIEQLGLKKLIFMPCRTSPFKASTSPASADDRLEMLKKVAQTLPQAEVSDWEIRQEGLSYSWQTVAHFLPQVESLSWLLGADQWKKITQWARADFLAEKVTFIVFSRDDETIVEPAGFRFVHLNADRPESSTLIRQLIGQKKDGWQNQVLPAVAEWITQRELYRSVE
jgi:nicotinate-nucleotide adenylyltransferase